VRAAKVAIKAGVAKPSAGILVERASPGTTLKGKNRLANPEPDNFHLHMESTKKTLYTADATAVGGRSGHVRSATGIIDLDMSVPEGLGGKKGATNPEELFAAGYSSCFQQALLVIATRNNDKLDPSTEVKCSVSLFQEGEGYGLSAVLDIDLKSFDRDKTIDMVRQAHKICPYSVGTRGNMEVELKVQGEAIPVQAEENAGIAEGK
jgi:Ohr subfamily peroxiredoxin